MYWSSSWARFLNVQDIIKERTKETSTNISSMCIPSTTIARLRCTSYKRCRPTYPPNSGSMSCQRRSPLLVYCRSIVYDAGTTLIHHWFCCILCAKTWHLPNAVLMLTHSHWPVIETASGECRPTDCTDCCIMLVTLRTPEPETPDNTIHWPNAQVILGHRLRRWAKIILTKTL